MRIAKLRVVDSVIFTEALDPLWIAGHHERMNIVVLTGAGISAESGLPTFRSDGGLWAGRRMEEVCTAEALERTPEALCAFYDERRAEAAKAAPNPAHLALAKLEGHWRETAKGEFLLVTQNVDDLHERAGSQRVIHMHGQLNSALCVECGWHGPRYNPLEDNRECAACGRDALRPDIVLFGEAPRQIRHIEAALEACDLFVAVGTSGTVYPAAGFVETAKARGVETHQFNIAHLPGSDRFDMCHLGNAVQLVPKWVGELIDERPVGQTLIAGQKAAFIKKMEDCGSIAEDLSQIDLDAEALSGGWARLYDQIIKLVQPEWLEADTYAPTISKIAMEAHGLDAITEMRGRGCKHRDQLHRLNAPWVSQFF